MKRSLFICLAIIIGFTAMGQQVKPLAFEQNIDQQINRTDTFRYSLLFKAGVVYRFVVKQKGIGVYYQLSSASGMVLLEGDTPNDLDETEKFEYAPTRSGVYILTVARFEHPENTFTGKFSLVADVLSAQELKRREKIKKELEAENEQVVQTLDIDHFWQAFDLLKNCRTYADSCHTFQEVYLDRATDGLLDLIKVRDLTPEKYVEMVTRYPKYMASIRKDTYRVKQWKDLVNKVFERFKTLYPEFRALKVCFAVGILNTGGTVSNRFVLIGTERAMATSMADLSEFKPGSFRNSLDWKGDLSQKIISLIAHECVHTQQATLGMMKGKCDLLAQSLREGMADFIGEIVSGIPLTNNHTYGNAHEAELWQEFKKDMCEPAMGKWLYNYSTVKNRPADLGYFVGYKIVKAYYDKTSDKRRALAHLIKMNDPLDILSKSGYNPK